jgi:hypothetical protein
MVLTGAMVMVIGCHPEPVPTKVGTPLEHQAKVIAKNFALHHYVRVTALKAARVEGSNLLEVKLGLENTRSRHKDMWCDIQVIFYDQEKFELEKTNWAPLFLAAGQVTYYTTCSLSQEAEDYTIFLRTPRETKVD